MEEHEKKYLEEETTGFDKNKNRVKYDYVNHSERATEKYHRISDGITTEFMNVVLEYFDGRCALTGEKFVKFDKKMAVEIEDGDEEEKVKLKSNLSSEHVIPLCRGGDDILPNLVPSVYQFNMQKNGYYPLDYLKQAKNINGQSIFSPYRLLKLINYMMKSNTTEARDCVKEYTSAKTNYTESEIKKAQKKYIKKFKKIILTPNEIDNYLKEIEEKDSDKIFSDVETGLDESKKKLKSLPSFRKENYTRDTEGKYKITEYKLHMMDIFLHDSIKIIEAEKEIANTEIELDDGTKTTVLEQLNQMFEQVKDNTTFEIKVRDEALEQLKELGIEENIYTVANEMLLNSKVMELAEKENSQEEIKDFLNMRFEKVESIGFDKQKTAYLISIMPQILTSDKDLENTAELVKTYCDLLNESIKEINLDLLLKPYFINALEIRKWMKENNTTKPPRQQDRNKVPEEEAKLGSALNSIRYYFIKPYQKLKTEEEKEEYKRQHPELEEVMAIIEEIDKNNIPTYLENALEIKKWMEKNRTTKPPRAPDRNRIPKEEAKLGSALNYIRQLLIKPYQKLKTEKEKEKYKKQHPELEEVMTIIEVIDRNNIPIKEEQPFYINALEIKKWMERNNTTKPPRDSDRNRIPKEEAKLGSALKAIRYYLIKPYQKLKTEKEKEEYKRQHPELEEVMAIVEEIDKNNIPIYLENALEIKKWMERNNTTKPPRAPNRNRIPEEEAKLGNALKAIRYYLIKPYQKLKIEEEKDEYKRQYPELEEVMTIIEVIDRNNIPIKEEQPFYINVLEIKKWMERNNTTKPPRQQDRNKVHEEEAKLGKDLRNIRQKLIKPYQKLETEGEKEEYKRQHPELEEVMAIVEEIDKNNIPIYLENALEIKKWMEKNSTTKPPRRQDRNKVPEEEAKLGRALDSIRQYLLKPYKKIKNVEEKEEYKRQHPELEEVMAIVEEIDRNNEKKVVKEVVIKQKEKGKLGENEKIEKEIFVETILQAENRQNEEGIKEEESK